MLAHGLDSKIIENVLLLVVLYVAIAETPWRLFWRMLAPSLHFQYRLATMLRRFSAKIATKSRACMLASFMCFLACVLLHVRLRVRV